jgi:hypothetical protein
MAKHADIPPTQTILPIDAPPDSKNPTTAMLKADINSGRTGDKAEVFDPGLSTLGTDDEAAGHPPSPFRIALARYNETTARWRGSLPKSAAHMKLDGFPVIYVSFIVGVGVTIIGGMAVVAARF